MNVLFFLTPKSEVAHLQKEWTLRQAIEKLERSGYTAIPMIDRKDTMWEQLQKGIFYGR